MTDPLDRLAELMERALKGEWVLRHVDEGLSAGCFAIDIPANKWTEMSTWYIGPENAALAVALRNSAEALVAIAKAAKEVAEVEKETDDYVDNGPTDHERLMKLLERKGSALHEIRRAVARLAPIQPSHGIPVPLCSCGEPALMNGPYMMPCGHIRTVARDPEWPADAVYTWMDEHGQRWFGGAPSTADPLKIEGRTLRFIATPTQPQGESR